ncbi:MAG: hypothetical protein JWR19_3626 [Pedosphaera sp.]|nr:hypothetical protein [Pedosphaera sp.]
MPRLRLFQILSGLCLLLGSISHSLADALDHWQFQVSGPQIYFFSITYGNGIFVAGGGVNVSQPPFQAIQTSSNGLTWANRVGVPHNNAIYTLTYGKSNFVAGTAIDGVNLSSPDGTNWGTINSGAFPMNGLTYGNTNFVGLLINGAGYIALSTDIEHWTNRALPTANTLRAICFGSGTFVAVGNGGSIVSSPDPIMLTNQVSTTANDLLAVTFGNGTFVAVGKNGTIVCSSNSLNWATQSSTTLNDLAGVAYGNGTFVAVGNAGTVVSSTDGTNWVSRNSGVINNFNCIAYGNNMFVAAGIQGAILTSGDVSVPGLAPSIPPANNGFSMLLSGKISQAYRIQSSPDLTPNSWTDLTACTLTTPNTNILDANAMSFPTRYYRAVSP